MAGTGFRQFKFETDVLLGAIMEKFKRNKTESGRARL
jgi:hypothetical protein